MIRCYVGMGSNLENPLLQLRLAADAMECLSGCELVGRSAIYRSSPLGGPTGQPDYLNAVVALNSSLEPLILLDQLQSLEGAAGRVREIAWGPRTLDLDLLLYGALTSRSTRLTLPHPRIFERNFVLTPLADLVADDWTFPDGSTLAARLADCGNNPLERLDSPWEEPSSHAQRQQA